MVATWWRSFIKTARVHGAGTRHAVCPTVKPSLTARPATARGSAAAAEGRGAHHSMQSGARMAPHARARRAANAPRRPFVAATAQEFHPVRQRRDF